MVTFGVQLGSVLGEALKANFLSQKLKKLFQGGTGRLIVVHFLFSALACTAVHHPHLYLKTQLEGSRYTHTSEYKEDSRDYWDELWPKVSPRTPCSSSFMSCSVTFGVLRASLRQDRSSSGRRYSNTSLVGNPRLVPCLEVEGTASSRIEPRSVVS